MKLCVALILAFFTASLFAADAPAKPNILVFLADDLGYGDVGFHGSNYMTPNLDRLAAEGIQLEQHYVHPMCSPTRTALMSGRYASRFGVTAAQSNRAMPFNTVTIASALQSLGYDTAITGKWHLGSLPEWGPRKFGFNHTYGALGGGTGPIDHLYKTGPYSPNWHRNDQYIKEEGHVTDLITQEAIAWLGKPRTGPFFLYVPFTAIHIPIKEPQKWLKLYPEITDKVHRHYAACVTHMDDSVARILAAIPADQQANTLVVFFSDNGGVQTQNADVKYPDGDKQYDRGITPGNNGPLRDFKSTVYDGGTHVAAFVHWPGHLKPGRLNMPTHAVDFMPTLCALAGYRSSKDLKWDGVNLWPYLTGAKAPEARTLYTVSGGFNSAMIRHGDWKLVVGARGKKEKGGKKTEGKQPAIELFNLAADPGEKNDLSSAQPEIVADLQKRLVEISARDKDSLPHD